MHFNMCVHSCNYHPDQDIKHSHYFFPFTYFTPLSPCHGSHQSILCVHESISVLFICSMLFYWYLLTCFLKWFNTQQGYFLIILFHVQHFLCCSYVIILSVNIVMIMSNSEKNLIEIFIGSTLSVQINLKKSRRCHRT